MEVTARVFPLVLCAFALAGAVESLPGQAGTFCGDFRATLVGTPGNDMLMGTSRSEVIAGLDGDDTIVGGGGSD